MLSRFAADLSSVRYHLHQGTAKEHNSHTTRKLAHIRRRVGRDAENKKEDDYGGDEQHNDLLLELKLIVRAPAVPYFW